MALLFLFLFAPAAGALRILPAGISAQNPIQLLRSHLLPLRRLCRQPVRQVPQDAHAVLDGLEGGAFDAQRLEGKQVFRLQKLQNMETHTEV